jgi:hypothetical protein
LPPSQDIFGSENKKQDAQAERNNAKIISTKEAAPQLETAFESKGPDAKIAAGT